MAREETINILYGIRADNLNLNDSYTKDKYNALDMAIKSLEQEPVLDKIRAEINRQEKWLLQAGYTAYNVDIAFDTIKAVLAESEVRNG